MQLPNGEHASPGSLHPSPTSDTGPSQAVVSGQRNDSQVLFGSGKAWTLFDYLVNLVVPLLILFAGFGVVVALGSVQPQPRPAPDTSPLGILKSLPVAEVLQVHSLQDLQQPLELQVDGVVVPYREMQLAAEVSGRVVEKSPQCRTGHFVQAGELLIRIDPTDYQQEVERLEQMVEQERESLNEIDQELVNAKLQLEIAAQDIALAEREVSRLQALPRGYASAAEADAAQKVLLSANQNRVTIENQINTLGVRRNRTLVAQRLVDTQMATAQINLQRCEVRSVADGVIVQENVELNSFIQRGSPIITLEDVTKAEVALQLRTDQLHWVLDQRVSQPPQRQGYSLPETPAVIEYEVSGLGGRTLRWNGRLNRYDGIGLDLGSRTVPVRVEVDAPQELVDEDGTPVQTTAQSILVRGMYVKVKLLIKPQTPLVVIPALSMRPGNRVWQFSPLPLDGGATAAADIAGSESDADTDAAPSTSSPVTIANDGFDPARWTAGSVSVLADLTPVDSIFLESAQPGDAVSRNAGGNAQRYWVCDVGRSGLRGGDWVVVSPLSDLGGDVGTDLASVRVRDLESSEGAR